MGAFSLIVVINLLNRLLMDIVRDLICILVVCVYTCTLSLLPASFDNVPDNLQEVIYATNYVEHTSGWMLAILSFVLMHCDSFLKNFVSCIIYSLNWYSLSNLMFMVKCLTQKCEFDVPSADLNQTAGVLSNNMTSETCTEMGGTWMSGFHISGHVFLLTFSIFILYPVIFYQWFPISYQTFCYLAAVACLLFCIFVLTITALYYHTFVEKVVGLLFSTLPFLATSTLIDVILHYAEKLIKSKQSYETIR